MSALLLRIMLAALLGAGSATLWPLTESSVASLSPADHKGSFTGLYQTALGLALMSGPVIAAGMHLEARQPDRAGRVRQHAAGHGLRARDAEGRRAKLIRVQP